MEMTFRALFKFTAEDDVEGEQLELSINAGDAVRMVDDSDTGDGWIKVRNSLGQSGFVPRDFLELIPNSPEASPSSPSLRKAFSNVSPRQVAASGASFSNDAAVIDRVDGGSSTANSSPRSQHSHSRSLSFGYGENDNYNTDNVHGEITPFGGKEDPGEEQEVEQPEQQQYGGDDGESILEEEEMIAVANVSTLYELAAEKSNNVEYVGDQTILPSEPASVSALLYSSDVAFEYQIPPTMKSASKTFGVDDFVSMTSTITRPTARSRTESPAKKAISNFSDVHSVIIESGIDLGGIRPMFSGAAESGDYDELNVRVESYFKQMMEKSQEDSASFLVEAENLSCKLGESVESTNTIVKNLLDLSDLLDTEASEIHVFSKMLSKSKIIDKSSEILAG